MEAVQAHRLVRTYGGGRGRQADSVVALNGIDLTIDEGEVHGLLGPNGAGKTTLCKILATVLLPTAGTARVCGYDVVSQSGQVKRAIGVVFGGDRGLYGRLTARQNLQFWAALYGLHGAELRTRVDALLERVGLLDSSGRHVEGFSRGMKQRLHLARGLVADPRVLILDEPTAGMDPVAARDFRVLVEQLRYERRSILLTTHDMAEAEAICDRVSLIDRGALLVTGRPGEIGQLVSRYVRIDATGVSEDLRNRLSGTRGVVSVRQTGGDRTRVEAEHGCTSEVLALLVASGVTDLATGQ